MRNASSWLRDVAQRQSGYGLRAIGQSQRCAGGMLRSIVHCPLSIAARGPRGFTLVEVLVALVVVSLGMLAVIQAVTQTASNSAYMRDKTIAHWVAMNRVTQARLEAQAPRIDKTSDEVEMAGRKWRWTMEVTQTPVDSVRRIDIKVRGADAPEDSSLASVTGFYGSAIAPPGTTVINWQGDQRRQQAWRRQKRTLARRCQRAASASESGHWRPRSAAESTAQSSAQS